MKIIDLTKSALKPSCGNISTLKYSEHNMVVLILSFICYIYIFILLKLHIFLYLFITLLFEQYLVEVHCSMGSSRNKLQGEFCL